MNPEMTWFTSDTHFGHVNILRHDGRPFDTIEQHDAEIIRRWNRLVQPRDTVYHLGDVCFRSEKGADWYLRQLNGKIHLIVGNHDPGFALKYPEGFASITHGFLEIKLARQKLVLCHYAMRTWPGSNRGSWHLHGHSHGMLPRKAGTLDVGINVWGYNPVNFEFLKTAFAGWKGRTHHPAWGEAPRESPVGGVVDDGGPSIADQDFVRQIEDFDPGGREP